MKHPALCVSRHLLLSITIAFIAGIALSPVITLSETNLLAFRSILFLSLPLLAVLNFLKKSKTVYYLLMPIFVGIGWHHGFVQLQLPGGVNYIYNRITAKTDVVLIGTMATMAGFDGRTSQVTIEAKSIRMKESVKLLPAKGKILLRLQGSWPDELLPGDTLAIRTELIRPDSFRTPGVFDYAQYLARKGIWITGFVRSPIFLHKLSEKQSFLHTLRYLPERVRTTIGRRIDAAVHGEQNGVYRAILIGDKSHLDENTQEIFKGSGTMHILAISGLHMAIIGTLLYSGIFWILSRSEKLLLRFTLKKWAAFFSLPILCSYGLLAGMNTPVFRAVIMSSIVIISICTNRQKSPGALLAFAAMLILTIDPLQVFTASFQLSFMAIIGILFLLPILKRLLSEANEQFSPLSPKQKIQNYIIAGFLVSLVANVVTGPIALYFFNRFSLIGPAANLIIEPLICLLSLTAGFISIPFIFIKPEIASFFLQVGATGLDAAMHAAAFFSSFSFSTIWLPTPPIWLLFFYYSILVTFVSFGRKRRWESILCGVFLSLCILLFFYPPEQYLTRNEDNFKMSYLDVGQGTATLVEYPSGFKILIDGGGSSFSTTSVGERIIAPFLWKKGIRKIDAVAITHPDADHYNGLGFIVDHFSPKTLWVRDKKGHDEKYRNLIRQAGKNKVSVSIPAINQNLIEGLESLKCIANISDEETGSENTDSRKDENTGLVLKACAQEVCALFPGDIGRSREKSLVVEGFYLKADVLLAAHHGSITSNSSEFLAAVSPNHLLVSAGRSSKGYFPHRGLAKECQDREIDLFTTSDQGTLQIISKKGGYQLLSYKRIGENPLFSFHPVLLEEKIITPR